MPNQKNGGHVPYYKDKRTLYVPIGCGECIECRKQKARQWQVRLNEEITQHKSAQFVTLTLSDDSLNKIKDKIKDEELNVIITHAVRLFLERYRKKYKVSLRHWLITELGKTSTERIHLHGIIFRDTPISKEELEEIWQYGWTDNGKYCNARTINYIVKYVTKIDLKHKTYKAKILCSPGLGKNYLKNKAGINKYKGTDTNETYRLPNGIRVNLPIYYRNHIYNESQRENLWIQKLDQQKIYVMGIECDISNEQGKQRYQRLLKTKQIQNIEMGYGDFSKEWKKQRYLLNFYKVNEKADVAGVAGVGGVVDDIAKQNINT